MSRLRPVLCCDVDSGAEEAAAAPDEDDERDDERDVGPSPGAGDTSVPRDA